MNYSINVLSIRDRKQSIYGNEFHLIVLSLYLRMLFILLRIPRLRLTHHFLLSIPKHQPPPSSRILAVYDSDPAGDLARAYLSQYPRVTLLRPPAHDLTDYFLSGGDLYYWLVSKL